MGPSRPSPSANAAMRGGIDALPAFLFFEAEAGIRVATVTGVQTCALPIFPLVRRLEMSTPARLKRFPLFEGPPLGVGLLAASLVLAVMMVPYTASVAREILKAVPAADRKSVVEGKGVGRAVSRAEPSTAER